MDVVHLNRKQLAALTRSLTDFSRMIEVFERHGVSFVSVTQQFNTTTSMGRPMLNILLSFAQFEREVTGDGPSRGDPPRATAVSQSRSSGQATSLKEIATREGIDNSYVSRMVNLTTLAPDIIAAILDDTLPAR